jgi:type I restriction-modification system DNA methylase subunit
MNIHGDDTLKINDKLNDGKMNEKWIDALKNGFDVIVGNPPFNKGGIRSHTGTMLGVKSETIWPLFIKNSLDLWLKPSGYLAFINPLSWLKKSHSMHDKMLEKHIVWLKLWDTVKSLAMINGEIPISFYI